MRIVDWSSDVCSSDLIDALDMVINVELARDSESHIRRVGRTGRAGEKGIAISLVAPSEAHRAQAIEQLQKSPLSWDQLDNLKPQGGGPLLPAMSTLCIGAGRKDKVRPGDILGALTGDAGIPGAQVGKIAIFDFQAYVAVERASGRGGEEVAAGLGTTGPSQAPGRWPTAAGHEHPVYWCRAQRQSPPRRHPRRPHRRRRHPRGPGRQDRDFRLPGLCRRGARNRQAGAAAPQRWQNQGPPVAGAAPVKRSSIQRRSQIGSASCRKRVCPYGEISVVAVSLHTNTKLNKN